MSLRVYNTLSGQKEPFEPIVPGKVGMYVCGVTVYDYCHIGHARANIVFDVIYRHLQFAGFDVNYVRNYTDVDDKIINRANERGISSQELSAEFIQAFDEDMDRLGLRKPTLEPKATEHIAEIITLIEKLIEKGCAYESEGDVYFAVESFPNYLRLSKRNLEDMLAGARIATGELKKNPMDFALWKNAKPGEPSWESPWGNGRPGWHIECSAMSSRYLGDSFDIHGGGKDLIFPHHENEIAQSEAASDKPFVKYWLHNGFVNIDKEKMSKSLGNFFTIRDILEKYDPEVLRFFILQAHYRSPIDFSDKNLVDARTGLSRIYESFSQIESLPEPKKNPPLPEAATELISNLADIPSRFNEAMNDDFNSALAIAIIFDAVRDLNHLVDLFRKKAGKDLRTAIIDSLALLNPLLDVLGICLSKPTNWLEAQKESVLIDLGITREQIQSAIEARADARANKDFAAADKVRDDLAERSIMILDTPEGTVWRIKYS